MGNFQTVKTRLHLPRLTKPGAAPSKIYSSGRKLVRILWRSRCWWFLLMQRFGEARELTFAIPERSWMYSFKEPFNHTMIRCPSLTLCFKNFLTNFKYVSLFQIFQQTSLGSTWLRPICLPQVHPPTTTSSILSFPEKLRKVWGINTQL